MMNVLTQMVAALAPATSIYDFDDDARVQADAEDFLVEMEAISQRMKAAQPVQRTRGRPRKEKTDQPKEVQVKEANPFGDLILRSYGIYIYERLDGDVVTITIDRDSSDDRKINPVKYWQHFVAKSNHFAVNNDTVEILKSKMMYDVVVVTNRVYEPEVQELVAILRAHHLAQRHAARIAIFQEVLAAEEQPVDSYMAVPSATVMKVVNGFLKCSTNEPDVYTLALSRMVSLFEDDVDNVFDEYHNRAYAIANL